MFKRIITVVIILSLQKQISPETGINQRIEDLKQQLRDEIEEDQIRATKTETTLFNSDIYYEYVVTDPDEAPIKPIIQYHEKHKKKHKHEQRSIDTSNTSITTSGKSKASKAKASKILKTSVTTPSKNLPVTSSKNTFSKLTPSNVFYRKMFRDIEEQQKPQKWTHCLDLITPYLNGFKDEPVNKAIDVKDGTVMRLVQLLSINTTGHSKDDIVSILYQISNLRLRIFQWDIDAITTLLNVIIPHPNHDFKSLKAGVKEIFRKWHLDTSNVAVFVKQTRIFRPPCIAVSEFEGSTKSSKTLRYTSPSAPKDSSADCR